MKRESGFYKVRIKLMPDVSTYEIAEYLFSIDVWYRCGSSDIFKDNDFAEIDIFKIL